MPHKESKAERFTRLAERRTTDVLNDIRLLKNLSVKANYEYSNEQYKAISRAIHKAVKEMDQAFKDGELQEKVVFSFKNPDLKNFE